MRNTGPGPWLLPDGSLGELRVQGERGAERYEVYVTKHGDEEPQRVAEGLKSHMNAIDTLFGPVWEAALPKNQTAAHKERLTAARDALSRD